MAAPPATAPDPSADSEHSASDTAAPVLDTKARQSFEELADLLVPGHDDRPWPSALGLGGKPLDAVLAARADLAAPLPHGIEVGIAASVAVEGPQRWMADLMRRDPVSAGAVALAVCGAYYMTPEVRRAIGYPGQAAAVLPRLDYPEYIAEGLLDHLLSTPRFENGTAERN